MIAHEAYVVGIDYGTDSCRTAVFDTADGSQVGSSVMEYPRWARGLFCDPSAARFRQHPLDYLETLEGTVREALSQAEKKFPGASKKVRALAVDTTGATPCAVDGKLRPLALLPEFAENPDAMFVLWKDHSATVESAEINRLVKTQDTDYTKYEGGIYSPEWFWSKTLNIFRSNPAVAEAAVSVVEHCDWMPALLAGITDPAVVKRSRCVMGHKAMWHREWDGYPPEGFFLNLNPHLARIRRSLGNETYNNVECAGKLCIEWAEKLGLPAGIPLSIGALDAHIGAIGGGAKINWNVKVMGTSTCDMIVSAKPAGQEKPVRGICGQVDSSIIPGLLTYEAGQSAFGDIYAWFKKLLLWPLETFQGPDGIQEIREIENKILVRLDEEAAKIEPGISSLLALDWHNGRRTPDANPFVSGALAGITLGSNAPRIYRALVEATAFGSRAIAERLAEEGVAVEGIIAVGGIARKSPLVMQIVSDVLAMPINVPAVEQCGSLGAAMCASVTAGLYPNVEAAQKAMGAPLDKTYSPDPARSRLYDDVYRRYKKLGSFVEDFGI